MEHLSDSIKSTINSLQAIYTVVLGLSLAEAFRQFVADNPDDRTEHKIRWDRGVNLISFLLLIVPFFQGMNRHLFEMYLQPPAPPQGYGWHLLVDCGAFTVEGGIFFILCRSLSLVKWQRFYKAVVVLQVVDFIWLFVIRRYFHTAMLAHWIWLDVSGIVALGIILIISWALKKQDSPIGQALAVLVVMLRTVIDYRISWSAYFPS